MGINQKKKMKKQSGMSLIELMIALLIGLLLSAAIITVYLSNKQTFWNTEAAASLQENSRFALKLIMNDLRLAGFYGGVDHIVIEKDSNVGILDANSCKRGNTATPTEFEYERSIWVARKGVAGFPGCIDASNMATAQNDVGSDVLFVKHVAPVPHDFTFDPVSLDSINKSKTKDTRSYIVAALDHAGHYNGVADNTTLKGYTDADKDFPDGQVWEYIYHAYFISKPAGNAFPQLRRKKLIVNNSTKKSYWKTETVAEGIQDIHFLFGVDTDSDGIVDAYVNTGTIDADSYKWEQVIAAKIYLLAQSTKSDIDYTDSKTYTYGVGDSRRTYTPGSGEDKYHRKLYETTVTLYNNQMERRRGLGNDE